jgi:predicted lipoprotein with Yx(FWY)xxD motif
MKRRPVDVVGSMKKLMIPLAAGAVSLMLAACGSSNDQTSAPASQGASGGGTSAVLKSASGLALYTPEGESASNLRCTGACAAIWKPVRPGDAKVAGAAVITRPDGTKQLAAAGKPLYTFAQDTPGAVTGNGASDAFGGKSFMWHAVQGGGKTAAAPAPSQPSGGGGYGSPSGY